MNEAEEVIRHYVPLSSHATSRGWFSLKCQLCNDRKIRAGFKFESERVAYSCFNCPSAAIFDPNESTSVPPKFKAVLDAYGIPVSDFNEILFEKYKTGPKPTRTEEEVRIRFNELTLPDYFVKLDPYSNNVYHQLACAYLEIDRGLDIHCHEFRIAEKTPDIPKTEWLKWKGRLMIPYTRYGKVIFYQGRDLIDSDREKYQSPSEGRDSAMYGYDEVYRYTDEPLYVHEGFFDAVSLGNSVAVFTNKMTEQQIEILNRCKRPKVVIPDRKGDGDVLALQGLKHDWSVSIPDIGGCKDTNEAMKKYGKLYVTKSIIDNTCSGFTAETRIAMSCK